MFYAKTEILKGIGKRIKELRVNRMLTMSELIDFINDENIDSSDYSIQLPKITYGKSAGCKIENGSQYPSTDFLFLVHKRFNKSLNFLVFGNPTTQYAEFERIYSKLSKTKQENLIDKCFEITEKLKLPKYRDDEYDLEDIFIDFRERLKEIKMNSGLSNAEFCKHIGVSKNTMEKYHSTKISYESDKYVNMRNSALEYLVRVCCTFDIPVDYLIEGTYYDDKFPIELSNELRCYNYSKQVHIMRLWIKEAKNIGIIG